MDAVLKSIESNADAEVALLGEAVAIPSVSTTPQIHLAHQKRNGLFFKHRLNTLGFTVEMRELEGCQRIADGREFPLPPLLLAKFRNEDPNKRTLLVYGHLDVQPAAKEDGWDTDPWTMTEVDGKLYGRGTTDDKGPVLCWTNAVAAFQRCDVPLPVNVRFILEGMEESGSEGLEGALRSMQKNSDPFLQNVDHVAIADTYWMGDDHPCVTYGIRGCVAFTISVECAKKDLHSGVMGGIMNEAMSDLIYFMDNLVDKDGKILVPGIYDQVRSVEPEEEALYKAIKFDPHHKEKEFGVKHLLHNADPVQVLQHVWRFPCLTLHGIEGCYSDPGFKTVIPGKVIGKFSIRIVPDMKVEDVRKAVTAHLENLRAQRCTKNKVEITSPDGGNWYVADPYGPNFTAARLAAKRVYGVDPYLTREGGSIPISIVLSEVTNKDVCFICVGRASDGAHGPNEKIDRSNYIKGAQMMAVYFHELAEQKL